MCLKKGLLRLPFFSFGIMSALIAGIPGWVIPSIIIIVSIIALTIILERGWVLLRQTKPLIKEDERQLLAYLSDKKYDDALSFCRLQTHPAYRIAGSMIEERGGKVSLKTIAEEEQLRQITSLEKYLPTLGTISTVAPLLGLLGTVTGMIKSFRVFEQSAARSAQLMGGIDEALITTALGLIVAIPALIMYNYYVRRVNLFSEEANVLRDLITKEIE